MHFTVRRNPHRVFSILGGEPFRPASGRIAPLPGKWQIHPPLGSVPPVSCPGVLSDRNCHLHFLSSCDSLFSSFRPPTNPGNPPPSPMCSICRLVFVRLQPKHAIMAPDLFAFIFHGPDMPSRSRRCWLMAWTSHLGPGPTST